MVIYLVEGSTGEYSDRREWPVKAFTSEDRAKELVSQLDARMLELGYSRNHAGFLSWEQRDEANKAMSDLDPHFSIDYTGTSYYYFEVELVED